MTRTLPGLDVDRFLADAELVVAPDDPRPGSWAGGPSALVVAGVWWLAWRLRRPVGEGRGFANVVGRSTDGVHFTPVATVVRESFGCDSLERPALVHTPDGRWRLYVSCATPGTKHWRVDLLEAGSVAELATAPARTVLASGPVPGSAVKDPVIRHAGGIGAQGREHGGRWHLWASVHPLDDPDATDRMTTEHAESADGVAWTWTDTALTGTPGDWDARGVRFATVLGDRALYDGRATAAENWEERTGIAVREGERWVALPGGPHLQSPHGPGGLRYADAVQLPDGAVRWFYEMTRPDGAHELRTVLLPPG